MPLVSRTFVKAGMIYFLLSTELPLSLAGRTLELLAVALFVALHWNRIVTYSTSK